MVKIEAVQADISCLLVRDMSQAPKNFSGFFWLMLSEWQFLTPSNEAKQFISQNKFVNE